MRAASLIADKLAFNKSKVILSKGQDMAKELRCHCKKVVLAQITDNYLFLSKLDHRDYPTLIGPKGGGSRVQW